MSPVKAQSRKTKSGKSFQREPLGMTCPIPHQSSPLPRLPLHPLIVPLSGISLRTTFRWRTKCRPRPLNHPGQTLSASPMETMTCSGNPGNRCNGYSVLAALHSNCAQPFVAVVLQNIAVTLFCKFCFVCEFEFGLDLFRCKLHFETDLEKTIGMHRIILIQFQKLLCCVDLQELVLEYVDEYRHFSFICFSFFWSSYMMMFHRLLFILINTNFCFCLLFLLCVILTLCSSVLCLTF